MHRTDDGMARGLGVSVVRLRAWALGLMAALLIFAALPSGPAGAVEAGAGPAAEAAEAGNDPAAAFAVLRLSVLDLLDRGQGEQGEGDSTRAGLAYRQLAERLSGEARDASGEDRRRFEDARQRLDGYWLGCRQILDLRRLRDRLNDDSLRPISVDFRLRLQRIMDGGRPAEAAAAGDAVISMLLVQQYVDRFISHHDSQEIGRARLELEAARHRLDELGRMLVDAETRTTVGEAEALIGSYTSILDQLVPAVEEEGRVLSEVILQGGDELAALLAPLATVAPVFAPVPAAKVESVPTPAQTPVPAAVPAPVLAQVPAPAPAPAGFGDYRLTLIVVLVAVITPVLGILLGWRIAERRRVRPAVSSPATPPVPVAEVHPPQSAVAVAAPPSVETAVANAVAAADWLVGMGQMVSMLNTTGSELVRLKEHAERVRAELAMAKERAEANNRAMSGFLAGMGDQLQGPLAAIVRMGDQLLTELDRHGLPLLTPNVEVIQWSGEQLLRMVEALRAMAEIEAGTLAVTAEDFLVDHLVADLRERVRPLTTLYGNRLTIQAAPGIGRMHSDYPKIRAALLHLLENACKFAENGDVMLVVMRSDEGGRAMVRFTVTDSGQGIARQHIEDIFEPFVSYDNAGTRGAGLGLTLVHHYALRLGGTIVVDSTPGRGSCFVLTLPADYQPEVVALEPGAPVAKLSAPA